MSTGSSREKRALLLKMEQCPSCFFKAKTWLRLLIRRVLLPMLVEDRINYGRNELALFRGTLQEQAGQPLALVIRLLL